MRMQRVVALSLITGAELEFYEPIDDSRPDVSGEIARLVEQQRRDDAETRSRVLRRVIYGRDHLSGGNQQSHR